MPFNIELLKLTGQNTSTLKPIKVSDIYDGGTTNFHEDGLYSISIFGQTGTAERSQRFSYIDLKVEVLHPIIFKHLARVKALYGDIIAGKKHATWNAKDKDFTVSDNGDFKAETGYAFFMSHFKELKLVETNSSQRNLRIKVIDKYRDNATTSKWLVLPAGLREVQISEDGFLQEDEINDMYRKVLSVANTVSIGAGNGNDPVYDRSRLSLQMAINAIYDHIENFLTGKKGFIQAKWGSRRIFNGTRNVITSMDVGTDDLDSPRSIDSTDTVVGLYQTAKGVLPLAVNWLTRGHLSKIFTGGTSVPLINRKTFKTEWVNVSTDTTDRWATVEGLEKFINYYGNAAIRHNPIIVEGKFLALIYKEGDLFKILNPSEYERLIPSRKELCSPITYAELLYLSGYREWNRLTCTVTRYPISGLGSTYPSTVYLKTTVEGDIRRELNDEWEPKGEDYIAYEFPRAGIPFFDTIGVNPNRLVGLNADFDGDTVSCNFLMSDDAEAEIHKYFDQPTGYIDPRGGLQMFGTDTIDWLLRGLTRTSEEALKDKVSTEDIGNDTITFYHYNLKRLDEVSTSFHRGDYDKELLERADKSYRKAYGVDSYLKHVSLMLGKLPEDVAEMFDGKHTIYKSGMTIYEHEITIDSIGEIPWELMSSPEEIAFMDSTPDDYDFKDERKRDTYMRKLRDIKDKNGYINGGVEGLTVISQRFSDGIRDSFKAMSERDDPIVLRQYSSTVPHLFVYPTNGILKVAKVTKVRLK